MLEPVFEKINFSRNAGKLKEQIKVQIKTDIPSDEVLNVLSLSTLVNASEKETAQGQINYAGKINFYLSYVCSDKSIKKDERQEEFSGTIKDANITDLCKSDVLAVVEKTEADTSSSFVILTAHISINIDLTACESVNALVGGQDIVVNQGEIERIKTFGVKKNVYPIEEEFELNYPIKEVLYHNADAVVCSAQSGVGSIIVDGQVLLSLVLLQNNDKNDIIRENKTFPFRIEVECEDAMPNMQAIVKVKEKSNKTDVSVDVESSKSLVRSSVNLTFEGEAFAFETAFVATDAFSVKNKVQLEHEKLPVLTACELRSHTGEAKAQCEVSELPVGATLLAVCAEKANVVSAECNEGIIKIVGTVSATALIKDEQKVFARKLEIPFEQSFEGGYDCQMKQTVTVKAQRANAKILTLTQMQLESELFFTVYPCKTNTVSVIKGVNVLEQKLTNPNAITVYIAEQGEELWSLAKRLNVCPEEVIATNKDLQFPLSGNERIVIYRGGNALKE